jgi:ankyrin repeat protein
MESLISPVLQKEPPISNTLAALWRTRSQNPMGNSMDDWRRNSLLWDVNEKDGEGKTQLHWAAIEGDLEAANILLDR